MVPCYGGLWSSWGTFVELLWSFYGAFNYLGQRYSPKHMWGYYLIFGSIHGVGKEAKGG